MTLVKNVSLAPEMLLLIQYLHLVGGSVGGSVVGVVGSVVGVVGVVGCVVILLLLVGGCVVDGVVGRMVPPVDGGIVASQSQG